MKLPCSVLILVVPRIVVPRSLGLSSRLEPLRCLLQRLCRLLVAGVGAELLECRFGLGKHIVGPLRSKPVDDRITGGSRPQAGATGSGAAARKSWSSP